MTSMKLDDEEQDILAGKFGSLPQLALQHQKSVGEFFGAKDFVPVTQAHIMADTESLGEAGVRWLESLAATGEGQRRVRIPTITDPRGTDFAKAASLGQTSAMLDLERRAISALVTLGVVMTDTCINYQTVQAPTPNEHVAFGDTGVLTRLGLLPTYLLMYAYYGKVVGDVAKLAAGVAPPHGPEYYVMLAVGVGATIVASMMITRAARRAIDQQRRGR